MRQWLVCLFCVALLTGCSAEDQAVETDVLATVPTVRAANPWVEYETLEEASEAVGFTLPDSCGSYLSESYRVMDGRLLEVVYRDDRFVVTIRKMVGEGQDLSGDYSSFEDITERKVDGRTIIHKFLGNKVVTLVYGGGYSYSLSAPNGYWGDSMADVAGALGWN